MPNKYKIYPDINFAITKLEPGVKSFEEVHKLANDYHKDKNFSKAHFQITDIRACSFDFNEEKFPMMKSLVDEYKASDNQEIAVYIVDNPIETAYVHMFFKSLGSRKEYCSTIEKAYELLNLPITFEEFQKRIDI